MSIADGGIGGWTLTYSNAPPEGEVAGLMGSLHIDMVTKQIYVKTSPSGATGWEKAAGATGSASNPILSTGVTSPPAGAMQYTPFHWGWLLAGNRDQAQMDKMLAAAPTLVGFMTMFYFKQLCTAPGTYNFTEYLQHLAYLKSKGKKSCIMLVDKSFDTDDTNGANPLPSHMATMAVTNNTGGYTAKRWDPAYVTEYKALVSALIAAVNASGNADAFEGYSTQETSLGLDNSVLDGNVVSTGFTATNANPAVFSKTNHKYQTNQLATFSAGAGGTWSTKNGTKGLLTKIDDNKFSIAGLDGSGLGTLSGCTITTDSMNYSATILADMYIDLFAWTKPLAPTKRVFFTMNYITGGNSQVDRIIDEAKVYNNVWMGGPDILHNNSSLNTQVYPRYATHKNDCPLFCRMSPPSYGEVGISMQDQFELGRDELFLNAVFWCDANNGTTGNGFSDEGAKCIAANPVFNDEPNWGGGGPSGSYYIPTGATGEWAEHVGELATWNEAKQAWDYAPVNLGTLYFDEATSQYVFLDGNGGYTTNLATGALLTDVSIVSNATYADIGALVSPVLQAGVYTVEGAVNTSVNATPKVKWRLHFSGTAANIALNYDTQGAAAAAGAQSAFDTEVQQATTGFHVTRMSGSFSVSAKGVLSFQAAQVTSGSTAETIGKGSWLRVSKVG